ncbi:cell wall / vacuolar inhibitor of fructosidase 2-like [Aristolochia californica]|uniref:cell wall / vacuolar inhibitor of fructosidase 2-like n=1 Tax=Aristolochia californica TaxID=171875 RepID=UPI0035D88525
MAKSFVPTLSLLCFSLCILNFPTNSLGLSSIQQACNNTADYNDLISYEFCVSAFQSVPESGVADTAGLLSVATQLARDHTTAAIYATKELKGAASDEKLKAKLLVCETQFAKAVLSLSIFNMERQEQEYEFAEDLEGIIQGSWKCERALQESGNKDRELLANEQNTVQQLVSIVQALAHFVATSKQ